MIKVQCFVKTEEEKKKLQRYLDFSSELLPLSCGIFDFDVEIKEKNRCTEKCEICGSQCCFMEEHDKHYCSGHSEIEESPR